MKEIRGNNGSKHAKLLGVSLVSVNIKVIQFNTVVPNNYKKMVCGNCFQVWRGSFKFTSQHALFIARNHPSERGKALFDYWMGRVLVFVAWFAVYVLFSRYAISDRPQHEGETFHAMDVDLTPIISSSCIS